MNKLKARTETRLSMTNVATAMEISVDALRGYMDEGLIPELPWEGLERGKDGTDAQ